MPGIIRFERRVDKAIHHCDQRRVLPLSQEDKDQETSVLFTKERGAIGDAQRYDCWLFVAGETFQMPPSSTESEDSNCLCKLFVSCTSAVVGSSAGWGGNDRTMRRGEAVTWGQGVRWLENWEMREV